MGRFLISVTLGFGLVHLTPTHAATLTTLANFNGSNGALPQSGLIADASGTLYGTTSYGGSSGKGTVFSLTSGGTLTTLVSFDGSNGEYPILDLVADASGTLYGTTNRGGSSDRGTVFSLTSGGTLTTLASFNGSNGASPTGGLIADASGTLYGTTFWGGSSDLGTVASGKGTVFSLTSGGTLTTLVSFDGSNGEHPAAGLIADASGTLYGTTSYGGPSFKGTVFSLTSGGTLTTLTSFDGSNLGYPQSGLIADASGTLYGTAGYTASYRVKGTVFSLTSGGTLTTLVYFDGSNGANPQSGLIADASGTLYGATARGGSNDRGTVFSLTVGGPPPPPPSAVLEPASWALLIVGFGLTGLAARLRRRATATVG